MRLTIVNDEAELTATQTCSEDVDTPLVADDLPGDLGGIAAVIGVEAAMALAREFKGATIYVPVWQEIERARRDARIRALRRHKLTIKAISRRLGISERTVYKVVSGRRGKPATPSGASS